MPTQKQSYTLEEEMALIDQAMSSDLEAVGTLYDLHFDDIHTFIMKRVYDEDEAYDLTAEVFITMIDILSGKKGNYRHRGNRFRSFLYKIALNVVRSYIRKKDVCIDIEHAPTIFVADDITPETRLLLQEVNLERVQQLQVLMDSVHTLKPLYREVIELFYFEGMSLREIAEIINKTEVTTRVTLHRAKSKLKSLLLTT